jgi:hypothetical protein
MIHALHRKKMDDIFLKIDFKKAYNKVKWDFFETIFTNEGVSSKVVKKDTRIH